MKIRSGLLVVICLAVAVTFILACDDGSDVIDPGDELLAGMVSNPVLSSAGGGGMNGPSRTVAATDVAYVSLPPDSIPNGEIAAIRNTRTGETVTTVMADGGFDPIPVAAAAGDQLELDIQVSSGTPVSAVLVVPEVRKPRVVRTRPTKKKRDVVLNAVLTIVFSEPISEQTIGPASVQLLRNGAQVSGQLTVTADGLRAEFQPDQLLAPNTDYVLSVTTGVTDLTGDPLEQAVAAQFTTGTTTATAMVYTDPAALFTVGAGVLRTSAFEAILHDDGSVTGAFSVANPASGGWGSGRVSCFSIVDGRLAWIAGVFEEGTTPSGTPFAGVEAGWMAADNGPPGSEVPDQLSFVVAVEDQALETPEDFCNSTPNPPTWDGLLLRDLQAGDIVVTGSAPPGDAPSLRRFSPGASVGTIDSALSQRFRVYVLDSNGNSVSGVPVRWAITSGGGSVTPTEDVTTDSAGVGHAVSSAVLTLTSEEATHTVTATAPTLPGAPQVTFTGFAVTAMVRVGDRGFTPSQVTVPPGRSVGWLLSSGAMRHNVTFEDDPTVPVSSGQLWPDMYHVRRFGQAETTIRYRCTYHSASFTEGEVGTVTVKDPSLPPPGPGIAMEWDLVADWRLWPTHGNPSRDQYGQPTVWHYLMGTSLDWTTFTPLTSYNTAGFGISGAEFWEGPFQSSGPFDMLPHVGINSTADWQYFSSLAWPPGTVVAHPHDTHVIVVGWQSPVDGSVAITGRATDLDSFGTVTWHVLTRSGTLANGSVQPGGFQDFSAGTGGGSLANLAVRRCDFVYLLIDADGDMSYDSTQLEWQLALLQPPGGAWPSANPEPCP